MVGSLIIRPHLLLLEQILKKCVICYSPFKAYNSRQITCKNPLCKKTLESVRKKKSFALIPKREPDERICVSCGKIFKTLIINKICCSPECSRKRQVIVSKPCRENYAIEYREQNREWANKYYSENKIEIQNKRKQSRKQRYTSWLAMKSNLSAKRRARKLNATPLWLTEFHKDYIKNLYVQSSELSRITGGKHNVDHEIPLQGGGVCGLHVPWNLQVITQDENLSKSIKY